MPELLIPVMVLSDEDTCHMTRVISGHTCLMTYGKSCELSGMLLLPTLCVCDCVYLSDHLDHPDHLVPNLREMCLQAPSLSRVLFLTAGHCLGALRRAQSFHCCLVSQYEASIQVT